MTKYEKMCVGLREELDKICPCKLGALFYEEVKERYEIDDCRFFFKTPYNIWLPSLEDLLAMSIKIPQTILPQSYVLALYTLEDIKTFKTQLLMWWVEAKHNKTWDEEAGQWVKITIEEK